jgi:hypothetical protein
MEIQVLYPSKANENYSLEELLSDVWLYRTALYTSLAYYTIGTKMRATSEGEGKNPKK